ncbi:hypothetical protein PAPYR_12850 [Paratrimastix pyriformis]|uniref:Uncharacterized protein n=1 Tax=Paratrimastix pyriformis TaxID=342808 RepID=A0ABQ8U171_9EUKA|nr:hypothetical protein PAPYR_12850 [Paratrimastix pyriformis]
MSNFPISGSSERAATALGALRPLSVLTSYSWSGCGCASLGKAFTVAVACGVNSGAEESFCGGPEFYAVKCRPGPSPGRTCYGIATPVSGCYRSGCPFCFAAHWVRAQAVRPVPLPSTLFRGPLRPAAAAHFAPGSCPPASVPWPFPGVSSPLGQPSSDRRVPVSSASCPTLIRPRRSIPDPAAPLPSLPRQQATPPCPVVQGSAARAGGVLCTAGGTVGISAGASAPGSGPISVGILTSWPGPPSGRFLP